MVPTSRAVHASHVVLTAIAATALAAGFACLTASNAYAASTFSTQIMDSSSYYSSKTYDITGDKKADKITIKSYESSQYPSINDKVKVFINGKRKLTVKTMYDCDATIFRIKSGRTFLYLKTYTDNSDAVSEGVYTYKSGKLVKVLNTYIWPSSFDKNWNFYHKNAHVSHSGVEKIKVNGNTVKIQFYNMTSIAGTMSETFSFKYNSGKLKLTSKTTTKVKPSYGSNKLTAATSFKIYSKSSSTGSVKKVKKGTQLSLKAIQLRPSDHFVSVKVKTTNGTTGWITYKTLNAVNNASMHYGTLFNETGMAG